MDQCTGSRGLYVHMLHWSSCDRRGHADSASFSTHTDPHMMHAERGLCMRRVPQIGERHRDSARRSPARRRHDGTIRAHARGVHPFELRRRPEGHLQTGQPVFTLGARVAGGGGLRQLVGEAHASTRAWTVHLGRGIHAWHAPRPRPPVVRAGRQAAAARPRKV